MKVKSKIEFSKHLDITSRIRHAGSLGRVEDEVIVNSPCSGKRSRLRGTVIGEHPKRWANAHIDAWVEWSYQHPPDIWLTLTHNVPTGRNASEARVKKFLKKLFRSHVMRRHGFVFTMGDWQRSRILTRSEKSWHHHIAIWWEIKKRPFSTHDAMLWIDKNWLHRNGDKEGSVHVAPYDINKRGIPYGMTKHQSFDVFTLCNGQRKCRNKKECQYKHNQ